MDFKKSKAAAEADEAVGVPSKIPLLVPIQGTVVHKPDGSVLGVICGHGWVSNEDGTPTMRPVINVIVPTDTNRKMVVVLPAEMANTAGDEEDKPKLVAPA